MMWVPYLKGCHTGNTVLFSPFSLYCQNFGGQSNGLGWPQQPLVASKGLRYQMDTMATVGLSDVLSHQQTRMASAASDGLSGLGWLQRPRMDTVAMIGLRDVLCPQRPQIALAAPDGLEWPEHPHMASDGLSSLELPQRCPLSSAASNGLSSLV